MSISVTCFELRIGLFGQPNRVNVPKLPLASLSQQKLIGRPQHFRIQALPVCKTSFLTCGRFDQGPLQLYFQQLSCDVEIIVLSGSVWRKMLKNSPDSANLLWPSNAECLCKRQVFLSEWAEV